MRDNVEQRSPTILRVFTRSLLVTLFLCLSIQAEPLTARELIVDCDCPTGTRLEYSGGKVTSGNDSFPEGVKPSFIIDDNESSKASVIFSSGTFKSGAKSAAHTSQAEVVLFSNGQITLLARYPEAVWIYSLFKNFQVGLFTVHKDGTTGDSATSSTYYSKCRFNIH